MKALKPSHKENKRYLLISAKSIENSSEIYKNVEKAILEFSGVLGLSNCGISLIRNIEIEKGKIILCVNRGSVDLIRASIAVFPEKISVEKVFGTLKPLKEKKVYIQNGSKKR